MADRGSGGHRYGLQHEGSHHIHLMHSARVQRYTVQRYHLRPSSMLCNGLFLNLRLEVCLKQTSLVNT